MSDIEIVGESFHQDEIRKIAKRVGKAEFSITLRPEPNNPYDENAVAVDVDGVSVGHLAKGMAKDWQSMILSAEAEGFSVVGAATVCGGTDDKPNLGVFGSAPWPGRGAPPSLQKSL